MRPTCRLPFFCPDYVEPDGWGHLGRWPLVEEKMHFLTQKKGIENNKRKAGKGRKFMKWEEMLHHVAVT